MILAGLCQRLGLLRNARGSWLCQPGSVSPGSVSLLPPWVRIVQLGGWLARGAIEESYNTIGEVHTTIGERCTPLLKRSRPVTVEPGTSQWQPPNW